MQSSTGRALATQHTTAEPLLSTSGVGSLGKRMPSSPWDIEEMGTSIRDCSGSNCPDSSTVPGASPFW